MNTTTSAMDPQMRIVSQLAPRSFLRGITATATCVLFLMAAGPVFAQSQGGGGTGGGGGGGGSGGGGGGGGGGGHTETAGNNLSVPVFWADTAAPGLTLAGVEGATPGVLQAQVTVPWQTPIEGFYAYAQRTAGNVWQAENELLASGIIANEIDWGDQLESAPLKIGAPIRIELALYVTTSLGVPLAKKGFEMVMLSNPSSPDEVQGVISDLLATAGSPVLETDLVQTAGEATVYSPFGRLVVQQLVGTRENVLPGDLTWTGTQWTDADATDPSSVEQPVSGLTFAGEINVGGKVIYGLSKGGFRARQAGDYRITFYLPLTSEAQFDATTVIRASEEVVIEAEEEGGAPTFVDYANNLTYVDIRVAAGGGSKGGKGRQ